MDDSTRIIWMEVDPVRFQGTTLHVLYPIMCLLSDKQKVYNSVIFMSYTNTNLFYSNIKNDHQIYMIFIWPLWPLVINSCVVRIFTPPSLSFSVVYSS